MNKHTFGDFRNFLYHFWKYLRLPTPTEIQYSIADWVSNGPVRRGVEAFRGVGKSWITAAYALDRLQADRQLNILVLSASHVRAENFTTFCLQCIDQWDFLSDMRPRGDQRRSRISFDVNGAESDQNPSLRSAGINGQITGSRAHLIIADDVETPDNSSTVTFREKIAEKIKEFDSILHPGGEVLFLGTPQTDETLYNILQRDRGYTFRIWPGRYPNQDDLAEYGDRIDPGIHAAVQERPSLAGQSTEPTRFSNDDLYKRELSLGKSTFAMQFMLRTSLADEDKFPLKLKDLIVTDLDQECAPERLFWSGSDEYRINDLPCVGIYGDHWQKPLDANVREIRMVPYQETILMIDPAGRGGDECAIAVVSNVNSYLYLRHSQGFQAGYSEPVLQSIASVARKYHVHKIIVEENFGDGMYSQLLKPVLAKVYPCTVEEVKHSVQKEKRIIDTLEPLMNSHRLVVDRRVVEFDESDTQRYPKENGIWLRYQLFYQMSHVTREKGCLDKDDRLDALASACQHFSGRMAADVNTLIARNRDAALQKELKKWYSGVTTSVFQKEKNAPALSWFSRAG